MTATITTDPAIGTLWQLCQWHARHRPHAAAITIDGKSMTYGELRERALSLAAALQRAGLGRGDRIGMIARNSEAFVVLHYAASLAGATIVAVNWRLSAHEVGQIIDDAQPGVVLAESEWAPLLATVSHSVSTIWLDGPEESFTGWCELGENPKDCNDPQNVLLMLYTTGTTGRAKGVMITDRNATEMMRSMSARWRMRPDMRFANVLPLFHVSGTGAVFSTMYAGGEVIFPEDASATAIARTIDECNVTHTAFVPTTLSAIVRDPSLKDFDLSSLEVVIYGAAPSGGTVVQDAMRLMPTCGFTQGYGLTETSGGVSAAPLRRHREVDDRPGTVGQPCEKYEIRVVNPETGHDVPAGTDGEVWVCGPQNALGYWNRPEETAASFLPDGWFRTGDIGVLDEDGYLYLKDRLKDMIISGGENVYSVEVESALLTHPGVLEAAVYGAPDPTWGEIVKAVIVRTADSQVDADALIEHTRTRLARYKCPRVIEFIDEMPKAASGKILKHELRRRGGAPA